MKEVVYSKEVQKNLIQIFDHIHKNFSFTLAEQTLEIITSKISSLKKFPYMGKTSKISSLVKEVVIEGNSVFYIITEKQIEITYIRPRKSKQKY